MSAITVTSGLLNADCQQAFGGPVERILVAVDFSASTERVLRCARQVAQQFGAAVEVLHVLQPKLRSAKRALRASLVSAMGEAARAELDKLIDVLWPAGTQSTIVLRQGVPEQVILDEARSSKAQLIMMEGQQLKGLRRWFQRHAINRMRRQAPCPVLLVPGAQEGQAPKFASLS